MPKYIYIYFEKVTQMAEVIQRQVNESYLMGYIKLPTKSRWWKFNGATEILLQAPHPPFLPPSPPPPLFLPFFFLPSIRGMGIVDCGKLIQT